MELDALFLRRFLIEITFLIHLAGNESCRQTKNGRRENGNGDFFMAKHSERESGASKSQRKNEGEGLTTPTQTKLTRCHFVFKNLAVM